MKNVLFCAAAFLLLAACGSMGFLFPDQTEKSVRETKDVICKHYCGRLSEEVRMEFRAAYGGAITVNCPVLCEAE